MPRRRSHDRGPSLSESSYVLLGLLEHLGPATPYDLKKAAAGSIGYFWDFPHSQFYVEPKRLAAEGLLDEEQEPTGRRRRVFAITDAGRAALRDWLAEPTSTMGELRDLGMLKLFFGDVASARDVTDLAEEQLRAHRARLAAYEHLDRRFGRDPAFAHQNRTLQFGLRLERAFITFWNEVRRDPPPRVPPGPLNRAGAGARGDPAGGGRC